MLHVPFFRGFARHLHLACLALTVAIAAAFGQTSTPTANDGFDPNVDGAVFALARQESDGKLLVVGQFANVSPNGGLTSPRNNIARFNADGSLDSDFNPNANGAIRTVVLQSDGRILIGGDFTTVGGEAHKGLARLNLNGTPDSTFKAGVDVSTTLPTKPQVFALAVQPDGSILVGGSFGTAISSSGSTTARNNIARFNSAGALDAAFDPNANGTVLAIALHVGGKVVIGGGFTKVGPASSPSTRNHIARLNSTGTVDSEFNPNADNGVTTLAVQADGKILLGGYFNNLQPPTDAAAAVRTHLARLNLDGTLDSEFHPAVEGNVFALTISPTGEILVGGHFTQLYSTGGVVSARAYAAKLAQDGSVDDSFNPGLNSDVNAIVVQADGKIVLGGTFTRAQPASVATAVIRNHVARVLPNGSLDTSLQLDAGGRILASVTQPDGKVVVAGSFTNVGGLTRNYVARLNTDGSVDASYNPNFNDRVYTLALQADGKVLAGGAFTGVGPSTNPSIRNHLARLNTDGSVDSEFNPNIDGPVGSIVVQSDGNILVGGTFSQAHPFGVTDAVARANLLRLTPSGQVDANFNPTTNGGVAGMVVQSDKKIVIVGFFTAVHPNTTGDIHYRNYIARLNSDGTVDTGFSPAATGSISAILLQSDGSLVIGGSFTAVAPQGATTTTDRHYIARLKGDGSLDTAFDPHANNEVLTLGLQSDNKIVVGGLFTTFQPNAATDWTGRKYVARLNADGTLDPSFNLDLNEVPGSRVDSITVLSNNDVLIGGSFTSLQPAGSGTRVLRNHFAKIKASGALDTTFDPGAGGAGTAQVNALALQADGKIVVGGLFGDLGGATGTNLARFNPEGTPDNTFNSALTTDGTVNAIGIRANGAVASTQLGGFAWLNANGTLRSSFQPGFSTRGRVNTTVVQPDGKLIIAGLFADLSNATSGNILRLNPNGTVDTSFSVTVDGPIYGMALQNGHLVIVGGFTNVNGTARNHIARVDTTNGGSLEDFNPNSDTAVYAVAIQSDGKVVIGGAFTSLTPNGATAGTSRNYIARLNSDGTVDTAYNPNANGPVHALVIEASGKVVAGGTFTTVQPNNDTSATTRNRMARFETDGNLDKNFNPNPNDAVNTIVLVPADQSFYLGGAFTALQPTVGGTTAPAEVTRRGIAHIGSDGALDPKFTPGVNGFVTSIALNTGGAVLVAGNFTSVTESGSSTAVARNNFARFSSAGLLDPQFNPDFAGTVANVNALSDGSMLVGGTFTSLQPAGVILVGGAFKNIGGLPVANLAQLNNDGSVNATFQPAPDQAVNAVLPLADGRFLVGGNFTTIAGASRSGLARFNSDGSLDTTFAPTLTGGVSVLAVQADGRILAAAGGLTGVVRFNADGSRDTTFAPQPLAQPVAIAVQPDGKIILAGSSSVTRVNADGSADASFTGTVFSGSNAIRTLTLQTDGSIIVAGSFTSIGGAAISRLARLKPNGAVDTTFAPAPNDTVNALALQSDGRLILGGTFSSVGGLQRFGLARLASPAGATQTLAVSADGKTITWLRGGTAGQAGTAGELIAVTFEVSTDGTTWRAANATNGIGSRVAGTSNWQLTNAVIPTSGNVFIRARGIVPTSAGKSAGVYEAVRLVNLASPVASVALTVVPVVSTIPWDESHYVWTVDAAGVLRISDVFSGLVLDSSKTILINGSDRPTSASSARLADLSTRGTVNPSSPLLSGFAITGSTSRTVLVRAVGPGLTAFGVTDALQKPQLRLYNNATGAVIGSNNGWADDASLTATFVRTGAFPFTAGSADAALVTTLAPGTYSVQVVDGGGSTSNGGTALVEIYDAGNLADTSSRLINLSSRGTVATNGVLIGGLVVSGNAPKTLLVRGVGPALTRYGVPGVLADPQLGVYDAQGNVVARNDNWSVSSNPAVSDADYTAAVKTAATGAGAFSYDSGSKDAALVITLPAGAYTIQISGVGGTAGAAMIEVYELP